MKVEFSLSFENYQDWCVRNSSTRRSKLISKLALSAFVLIGLGYFFAAHSKSSSVPDGVLAIFVGFCLTALLVPLWFLLERENPEKSRLRHQDIFEKYFRQPRSLEFDESGWTFIYGNAVNARPWSDLTSFSDFGRTIVLVDTFVHYPLAAAAFTAEQKERLKELSEKALAPEPKLFSVPMFCTSTAYVRSMAAHFWRKHTLRRLALYALGCFCAFLMGTIFADAHAVTPTPIILGLALLMPIIENATYLRKFNSYYSLYSFHSVDISQESLCFRKPLELRKIRLDWITEIRETWMEFCIYVDDDLFYMIPKQGLPQEQIKHLRQLHQNQKQG